MTDTDWSFLAGLLCGLVLWKLLSWLLLDDDGSSERPHIEL